MSQFSKRLQLSVAVVLLLFTPAAFSQTVDLGENCNLVAIGASEAKRFLAFDQELRDALRRQDVAAMALLVRQPLRVNGDRGSYYISDPRSLQLRFKEIFTPAVRHAVLTQRPEAIFCNMSGVMYGNGTVWVDLESEHYRVKTINLPVRTLPKHVKEQELDFVCETNRYRIIVDASFKGKLRYRAWNKPRPLTQKPDLELLNGKWSSEGSGPCRYDLFTFTNGKTQYEIGELPGCGAGDADSPPQSAIGQLEVVSGDKTESTSWCY